MSLGRSPTVQCILKRADGGSDQAKMLSLSLHLKMHIFKQQLQQFSDARCITSEKNTVWKHPCYFVSKYKTSTNKLLQSSKKSFFSPLSFVFFFMYLFFLDKTQFLSWVPWTLFCRLHFAEGSRNMQASWWRCFSGSCWPEGQQLPGLSQGWEGLWIIHIGYWCRRLKKKTKS